MKTHYKNEISRKSMTVKQFLAYEPARPYKAADTLIYCHNRSIRSISMPRYGTANGLAFLRHGGDENGYKFFSVKPSDMVTVIRKKAK